MVAAEEKIEGIAEFVVLCDLRRRQMAMVVDDGKILNVAVKLLRRIGSQKKIIVNDVLHGVSPFLI